MVEMKRFRFIRTGDKPVGQEDHEYIIRACFDFCTDEVKQELDAFFQDAQRESVTFDFGDQQVRIERE